MNWEDTVMSREELTKVNDTMAPEARYGDVFEKIAVRQAEITWPPAFKAGQEFAEKAIQNQLLEIIEASKKAGMKELMQEIEKVSQMIDTDGKGTDDATKAVEIIYYIGKGRLQAFLSKGNRGGRR